MCRNKIGFTNETGWRWKGVVTFNMLEISGFNLNMKYQCKTLHVNSMKRQTVMTLKDELPRSVGAQYATGDWGEITPERMKRLSQSRNKAQLWM